MNLNSAQQLHALAASHGVHSSYIDMSGARKNTPDEILIAVLEAMGVPARKPADIRDSLRHAHNRKWEECVSPVIVAWDGKPTTVRVHLRADTVRRTPRCELHLENGYVESLSYEIQKRRTIDEARLGRNRFVAQQFSLPPLPPGYHVLEIETAKRKWRALVLAAPTRAYSGMRSREWGVFMPMYAAQSEKSWGAGNFTDWQRICRWAGSLGAGVAGSLPMLAAFLDMPVCDPSPYSPASRLFWNEFYLDVTRVPEFARCVEAQDFVRSPRFQNRLETLRQNRLIDYCKAWRVRREVLEKLARHFFQHTTAEYGAFEKFIQARPEVKDYARFRAACDATRKSWRQWPRRMREGRLAKADFNPADERFHLYIQWRTQEQLDQVLAASRAAGVEFYLDLPLGVHPDSFDVWRERERFALKATVGAPPDMFFTKGQDWGFSPLHPEHIRERGYDYVRALLNFQMRHTGLLRIDHVMGLHRLYWIPQGFPPDAGAYVSYAAEEWFAILNLESTRCKTTLAGENLGTVPPEVNDSMKGHGLRELFVLQYEQQPDPRAALRKAPALSIASINTHDMPTFKAHWDGLDLVDRANLGLIPQKKLRQERARRRTLKKALASFLRREGFLKGNRPDAAKALDACIRWLAAGPANIVLVTLEDLWREILPQNVPGTYHQRPNWRRKARLDLKQIEKHSQIRTALRRVNALRRTKEMSVLNARKKLARPQTHSGRRRASRPPARNIANKDEHAEIHLHSRPLLPAAT